MRRKGGGGGGDLLDHILVQLWRLVQEVEGRAGSSSHCRAS